MTFFFPHNYLVSNLRGYYGIILNLVLGLTWPNLQIFWQHAKGTIFVVGFGLSHLKKHNLIINVQKS
jgi:hypothetical protein